MAVDGLEKGSSASDRREFSMKTRQRDLVHEIRAVVGSVWAAALKGRGGILDHGNGEPQVSSHSHRTGHAVVGGEPGDDERVDSTGAQMRFEAGSNEGAVDMFAEDRFVGYRQRFDLESVARLVFAKRGMRLERHMLDVDDGPAGRTPSREQIGDPLFRVRVVPRSQARIVQALLHVDEE
jgi:hypothetical protein